MKFYRLLGEIARLILWPFAWPVFLFKRIYGKDWLRDEHDNEWGGALALQFVWLFGLLLLAAFISIR